MKQLKVRGAITLPQNKDFVSVREAAQLLGSSERYIYSSLRSGKSAGEKIGQTIVIRRKALTRYQHPAARQQHARSPMWRTPAIGNPEDVLRIEVRLHPGKASLLEAKLKEIQKERKHLTPGCIASYFSRLVNEPEEIHILLVWQQQLMPSTEELHILLENLRADLCDWENATHFRGQVILNT